MGCAIHFRKIPLMFLTLLVVFGALAVHAEHTRHWRQSSLEEFLRGTATGVALSKIKVTKGVAGVSVKV